MCLLTQHMKPHVSRNGDKNISNCIMRSNSFPTMGIMKKVGPYGVVRVGHICNESPQELKDGGGPISV
jgi:hypothetical protein